MKNSYRDAVARKEKILEMLVTNGNVRVSELSEVLNASSVTVRNDLSELQEKGMLTRTHGGAVLRDKAYLHITRSHAMMRNVQKKSDIASACANHIHDNDTIIANSGTTGACAVRELTRQRGLTLLTNSVLAMQEAPASIEIIMLGGRYEHNRQYTCGDDTKNSLNKYMADKAILSVDGITQSGFTTQKRDESAIVALMAERSGYTIVTADSSKLGKTALSYIAAIDAADLIITNKDADEEIVDAIRAMGIGVELV